MEKKIPENMANLDMHLSMVEPLFDAGKGGFIFSTPSPSLADIALYYELDWGSDMAAGHSQYNLTGGESNDTDTKGAISRSNYMNF